jgi:predicted glycogen debranching enzyme
MTLPPSIEIGRSICGDLASAERREWVVTNGLGGFASGTVAGSLTRRYHGLLVAALEPPGGRTLLVAKCEEVAVYGGVRVELGTNRWNGGTIAPHGYANIERFALDGTAPVWTYAVADALLEKRVWMEQGVNATYVRYSHVRGRNVLRLTLRVLGNYRGYYQLAHAGDRTLEVTGIEGGVRVSAFPAARPYFVVSDRGACAPSDVWYRDFVLADETERGLDDREDHLCVATFAIDLDPGETVTLLATDREPGRIDAEPAWRRYAAHEARLSEAWSDAQPEASQAPGWLRRCVVAAGQFVVAHPRADDSAALSVIAGYPWFGAWGRDTMIALKGLTLATGRPDVAAKILSTFAAFIDGGMLPNDFPDTGAAPEYNTVDAALWFVEAVAAYVDTTGDRVLLRTLWPKLAQIVDAYCRGTRFGIRRDPADGLIRAGEPGVQLTWMDAKVGDWVVTPRIGKPVEIAALWYNALERLAELAPLAGADAAPYARLAASAKHGFARYWNARAGFCFDVLDGPDDHDASLRPNQLLAISLPFSPLEPPQQRAVVDVCARRLLASTGLRSLAPGEPNYVGHYGGSQRERDAAYHQGTSWLWLLGVFSTAYARAYADAEGARAFLDAYGDALLDGALGTLGEIADGDAPFAPRGAFAQAWSVAEAIRAWHDAPHFAKRGTAAAYYAEAMKKEFPTGDPGRQ